MPRTPLLHLTRKDFKIEAFGAGGPGGQHQNKTASAVRITHLASGATGEARDERSQYTNKKHAFERLAANPKFRAWLRLELARRALGTSLEERVDAELAAANVVAEVYDTTQERWVPFPNPE